MSIISALQEIFSLKFMVYALISGTLVSVCASLLGVTLVLKRYSMIGDGLSHVAFGSLAVAAAVGAAPMKVAIPVVIAAAFLLLRLSEKGKLKGDALTALISTGALAVGIMAISLSSGMNIDIYNYMFGSILALTKSDMILSVCLAAVVIPVFVLLYNSIFAVTFDPDFARATGTRVGIFDTVIAVLTAVTIVLGMRLMGTLLISSLIVFPPLTSMRVTKSFRGTVTVSSVIPVFSFVSGLMISYFCSTPPGASVVCVNIALFAVFALIGALKKRS
ncbi:MAG: metal ABC transporter permease [Firmicutes bacterium]|jgi:ABC-type Mn2+/Zn2+ transport system permease subunit|uniref:Metal ABC transporter permease n=1 Tax=Candidatus Colimorpha enterica TaxID=3083063 RepID=A0AAE3FHW3_9BACT|nr:metal ABC transporter permease [Candidatus Colimorpha enterica]MCI5755795.1 metal ABC transporter permease [Candidatus Colimorpha enterica]MDD6321139.1 metal ABC transporter permease [Bacillota bacterium]OLA57069.1 MAG: ABC transporter [Firmicutes bacterium CAG:272_52_7]